MKSFLDFLHESAPATKFSARFSALQLQQLRKQYGSLTRIDPLSSTYKNLISMLDSLPLELLKQLASAKIAFVSTLAFNRVKKIEESYLSINARSLVGYDFRAALMKMKSNEKIIFGDRSNKFHIIDASDRDYNTSFAFTKAQAQRMGENGVKNPGGFVL
jgi:hypothetical protein